MRNGSTAGRRRDPGSTGTGRAEQHQEGTAVVGKVSNPHTGVESETILWATEAGEWEWQAHTQLQGAAESKMHHYLAKEQLCLVRSPFWQPTALETQQFPTFSLCFIKRLGKNHQFLSPALCVQQSTDWQDPQTWASTIDFNTVLIVNTGGRIRDSKEEMFTWGIILTN